MIKVNKALLVKKVMKAVTGNEAAFEFTGCGDFENFPNFRKVALIRHPQGVIVELGSLLFAGDVHADYTEVIGYIETNKDTILEGYRVETETVDQNTTLLKFIKTRNK